MRPLRNGCRGGVQICQEVSPRLRRMATHNSVISSIKILPITVRILFSRQITAIFRILLDAARQYQNYPANSQRFIAGNRHLSAVKRRAGAV